MTGCFCESIDFIERNTREIAEVPEDSEEARKWPLYRPPSDVDPHTNLSAAESSMTSSAPTTVPSTTTDSVETKQKPAPRPGPRKPKKALAPLPGAQKAKKLTTLGMSAMDWRAHVTTVDSPEVKNELEANRKGGGFLEKVEFLQRVEERKQDALDAAKSKRRRI